MSLTLCPSNLGLQRGFNGVVELGINIQSLRITITPEIDDYLNGPDGQALCNAVGDPQGEMELTGEYRSNAGTVVSAFVTPFVPVNPTNLWGRSAGGWYLKSGEQEIAATGWKSITTRYMSKFAIA